MESVKSVASDFTRDWTRRLGYRRPGSGGKDKAKVAQRLPGGRPAKPEPGPRGAEGGPSRAGRGWGWPPALPHRQHLGPRVCGIFSSSLGSIETLLKAKLRLSKLGGVVWEYGEAAAWVF